jgi:hypothetical protein
MYYVNSFRTGYKLWRTDLTRGSGLDTRPAKKLIGIVGLLPVGQGIIVVVFERVDKFEKRTGLGT